MARLRQIKSSDSWAPVPIKLPQSWIDVLKQAADRSGWTMSEQIRYTIGRVYNLLDEEKRPYFPLDEPMEPHKASSKSAKGAEHVREERAEKEAARSGAPSPVVRY